MIQLLLAAAYVLGALAFTWWRLAVSCRPSIMMYAAADRSGLSAPGGLLVTTVHGNQINDPLLILLKVRATGDDLPASAVSSGTFEVQLRGLTSASVCTPTRSPHVAEFSVAATADGLAFRLLPRDMPRDVSLSAAFLCEGT